MNGLNDYFNLNLNRKQIKNQKNVLRSQYSDYKFLSEKSGFGWDSEKCTVTADPRAWNELIDAHPCRNFAKLKDKPFPIFELAERVFSGTFATGEAAESQRPPTQENVPTASSNKKKRKKAPKKTVVSDLSDDEVLSKGEAVVKPTPTDPINLTKSVSVTASSNKRARETKGHVVTTNINNLIGAIDKAATTLAPCREEQPTTAPSSESIRSQALKQLSLMFLNEVNDEDYLKFIWVVEDNQKASTFLSISQTSTKKICRMWLDREVSKSA
jgi:hypothetical protein